MGCGHLLQRHPVRGGDGGIGQVRSVLQGFKGRSPQAHAGGLNSKHFAAEEASQVRNIIVLSGFGQGASGFRQPAELFHQLRHADQLLGEVGAVLKNVERVRCHGCVRIEKREPFRIRRNFLEKMFERARAAPQPDAC